MRILAIHADYFEYEAREKIKSIAEEIDEKEGKKRIEEPLVVFITCEAIDDDSVVEQCAEEIDSIAKKVGAKRIVVYPYAHLSSSLLDPASAVNLTKMISEAVGEKGYEVCSGFKEWDEVEREKLPEAIKTCYEKLCVSNEIVLVESYNNEIPILLPEIKHALMVAPGKVFIYEGKEFSECFEANARAKGRTLGEEIYREIKPAHIMELSPLKREQLEDYDFLAREIGRPILETMDVL